MTRRTALRRDDGQKRPEAGTAVLRSLTHGFPGERGFEPPTPWSRTRCSTGEPAARGIADPHRLPNLRDFECPVLRGARGLLRCRSALPDKRSASSRSRLPANGGGGAPPAYESRRDCPF